MVNFRYTKEEVIISEDEYELPVYFFETLEDFECAGDEVLVESSPPASPHMAARLAQPAQNAGGGAGGGSSPSTVRELIVIPEIPTSIQLHHAIQQVSTAVEGAGAEDSSGQSSPSAEPSHATYITVAKQEDWDLDDNELKVEIPSDFESEGANGVNYHVQYVEQQEVYTHQGHMESLRSYPVYAGSDNASDNAWGGASTAEYTAYGVVVAGDEPEAACSPPLGGAGGGGAGGGAAGGGLQPPRMPPATVQWLQNNYETAEGVSLPRSTLYAHYLRHCAAHRLDPVNAASFGKLIRSVFIGLRTRRLGTRGNSKYHYYGIRAKTTGAAVTPPRHDSIDDKNDSNDQQEPLERDPEQTSQGLANAAHRQYLGAVMAPDPPALALAPGELPADVPSEALEALRKHHRDHGAEFLEAVAALDTAGVERSRRAFWRRPPAALCRRTLLRLAALRPVADWLKRAELQLYQRAVELLLPDVLRPIPPQLTQSIRNFAKSLSSALAAGAGAGAGGGGAGGGGGGGGAPALAARAQASAAAALAAALRRYTSLNHLAQAARAVLTNHHQIQQMLADLNRVDFRVVREQAAWACSCAGGAVARRLEGDFKATLGRGASLEQWAEWLEGCVRAALQPHCTRPDYAHRARRLLLDWSFYSSLVIRELTLRSAASFGSFHLIRLLYDEYVSYLIERRVAAHLGVPPIAVMQPQEEEEEEVSEDPLRSADEAEAEAEAEADADADPDDPDWEWDDDEEEDDLPPDCKRARRDHSPAPHH